jgi:D-hydroxyproline dehydrogenase subunit alpha
MSHRRMQTSILIVGGGPAGMAAACAASESGAGVTLIDLSPSAGGQIWRGAKPSGKLPKQWFERFAKAAPERIQSARIVSAEPENRKLLAELPGNDSIAITFEKLILATGARELFLPFPGWTLPGVVGAGGLQALVKSGLDVRGKRVVLAGSGPLLLAVADLLREREAEILLIAEQASGTAVNRFGLKLASSLGKLAQAIGLRARLASIPYLTGCWVESAQGDGCLRRVQVQQDGRRWTVDCDYLGTGYGLVPNTELAELLGCAATTAGVVVDPLQLTTIEGVYCAGEAAGIGGVDKSLVEGSIAGYSASGNRGAAQALFAERERTHKFAQLLNAAFALRPELRLLTTPETIVCRCEDVRLSEFDSREGWRDAKLQSRCGMGRCQSRVCGPAIEFLKGWHAAPAKPPIFPARVGTLVADDEVRK